MLGRAGSVGMMSVRRSARAAVLVTTPGTFLVVGYEWNRLISPRRVRLLSR